MLVLRQSFGEWRGGHWIKSGVELIRKLFVSTQHPRHDTLTNTHNKHVQFCLHGTININSNSTNTQREIETERKWHTILHASQFSTPPVTSCQCGWKMEGVEGEKTRSTVLVGLRNVDCWGCFCCCWQQIGWFSIPSNRFIERKVVFLEN